MRHPLSYAKQRYGTHKRGAKRRGIDFDITFDDWYNWWLSNGIDKNYPYIPGNKSSRDQLCMCRKGDNGPYHIDNIYCATQSQNSRDRNKNKPNIGIAPPNKGIKGVYKQTPESIACRVEKTRKAVQTPDGIFVSRREAAKHYGWDESNINYYMKVKPQEFYYV